MARSGFRILFRLVGRPIAQDIGIGSAPGVGRGLTTRLGDLLRSTTGVGTTAEVIGAGARGRSTLVLTTDPPLSDSWADSVSELVLAGAAVMAGSLWVGASHTIPGITAGPTTGAT